MGMKTEDLETEDRRKEEMVDVAGLTLLLVDVG
jgi:hypothetical protein